MNSIQSQVVGLEVLAEERCGDGGFLAIRRLRLQNRRANGSRSAEYVCDFVMRSCGSDAVVALLYRRAKSGGLSVLLREELRPALVLGREHDPQPMFIGAVVAGLIEKGDLKSERGIVGRVQTEVYEEAGFRVPASAIEPLGAPVFSSPGTLPEKLYFFSVRIGEEERSEVPAGDGSPMEEGSTTRWLSLSEAIAECEAGQIRDMKTELILRRLAAVHSQDAVASPTAR